MLKFLEKKEKGKILTEFLIYSNFEKIMNLLKELIINQKARILSEFVKCSKIKTNFKKVKFQAIYKKSFKFLGNYKNAQINKGK